MSEMEMLDLAASLVIGVWKKRGVWHFEGPDSRELFTTTSIDLAAATLQGILIGRQMLQREIDEQGY
jgi:hypothetical protein